MLTVKEYKNNAYNTYKAMSEFELKAGENHNTIREKRLTSARNNVKVLNNKGNIFCDDEYIIAETEGILQGINEICPEIVCHVGKAKLNGQVVTYQFKEVYHYKLFVPSKESINYCIARVLHTETDHKINGENKGRFAVDIDSRLIYLST